MRIGIIGPGLIWKKKHEPVLQTLPDVFKIVAFCDSNDQSQEEIQQNYPGTAFMTNYQDFVRRDDIDGIVVLTPIPLNAPVAIAALEAGKHVFLEKPVACSLAEANALLAAARRSGKRLYILEQDGFDLRWRVLRDVVHSGEIGQVVTFGMVRHSRFGDHGNASEGYGRTAWRQQSAFPLGRLFDGGHHNLTQLAVVFGQPDVIFASAVKLRPEYGEYDHILTHISYQSGVRGYFSYAGYLPKQRNYFHVRGAKGLVSVEVNNTLSIEQEDGLIRIVDLPSEAAHVTMWREIAEAITQGGEVSYTPQDALRELTTLIRIDESAKTEQPVPLRLAWPST
jgi:predicted dehydrogenase